MGKKQPGVPKQPKPAKQPSFTINDSKADFQGKLNIQKGVRSTAPKAPKMTPDIQKALDKWSADTDQAGTTWDTIINLEKQLEQLYANLGNELLQCGNDRAAYITAVRPVCTTPEDAQSFGGTPKKKGPRADPLPPAVIRQIDTGVPGQNRVRWPAVDHARTYVAETSTVDPPTPASWVSAYAGSAPFFLVEGTPGQKTYVRIASVGRSQSVWSTQFWVVLR